MTDDELLASLTGYTSSPWRYDKSRNEIVAPENIVSRTGKPVRIVLTFLLPRHLGGVDAESANGALLAAAPDLHRIALERGAEIERLRDALRSVEGQTTEQAVSRAWAALGPHWRPSQ